MAKAIDFVNPFRPGAGQIPPYLAGRVHEREEFLKLLDQAPILANPIITGLRGVGKTSLLDTLKPHAISKKWLWVGNDLSEAAGISESNLVTRILADVSVVSSSLTTLIEPEAGRAYDQRLDFNFLLSRCNETPGLMSDKLRSILELIHSAVPKEYRGIVFAYDEAQKLSDRRLKEEYPLSVLLEVFQSLQKRGIPFMLCLTGLPTLFPKLVEARTYAERMFHILQLEHLSPEESEAAIRRPLEQPGCPVALRADSVALIRDVSGGYPYFIQFICREAYDALVQKPDRKDTADIPIDGIIKKLDNDFYAGRWSHTTDRQRELLVVIAHLPTASEEFTVKEITEASQDAEGTKPFSKSQANQMLADLAELGFVFKNRHGKYAFAVPMLDGFIKRQLPR